MCKERTRNIEIVAAQGFRMRGSRLSPPAKTRNRCSFYCGDFSLDRPISSAGGAARKKSFNIKHRVK